MAVITISRGSFSGGKILAECLAQRLGYRCLDREIIVERAAAYGVTQEELRRAITEPPSFWDRFRHRKYMFLTLFQAALTEEVRAGRAVYHSNAGHLLLRGVSHVLRTRIIAPLEKRVAMVEESLKMSADEAAAYIEAMDQDRRRWTHYLYGVDWGDPALYDVVLNLESMEIGDACETICLMAAQATFAETPESSAAMENLALASRVRANLVIHPATSGLEVEVEARAGAVTVRGKLAAPDQAGEIQQVVRAIPGVTDLAVEGVVQSTGL